jgi:DNA-binding transcriptional LysR family regulator
MTYHPEVPSSVLRNRLLAHARLRHLQVLVRVAELGSLHKAAADVGMTQPAVSQQLAALERLLEAPLFLRSHQGVELTALGRSLVPVVQRLLRTVDEIAETSAAVNANALGVVRVVSSGSAVGSLLSRWLPPFSQQHPEVAVNVREAEPARLGTLISLGEADLVVCREPSTTLQGWHFVPLHADRLVVVASSAHPLLRKRRVSLSDLATAEWLSLPIDSKALEVFDQLFAGLPPPPRRQITTRTPAIMWAMLAAHPLLTLIPASLAQQLLDEGRFKEVPAGLDLPMAPIGMLLPLHGHSGASAKLAEFLARNVSRRRKASPG